MSQYSVITEEMRQHIGFEYGPTVYEVDKRWVRTFAEAIEDPNPLFYDEEYAKKTRFGGIVAPPGFPTALRQDELGNWIQGVQCSLNTGALNGGNEIAYFEPIRPGDVITVKEKLDDIVEKDTKRGKMLFFNSSRTYTNQSGKTVAILRSTGIRY